MTILRNQFNEVFDNVKDIEKLKRRRRLLGLDVIPVTLSDDNEFNIKRRRARQQHARYRPGRFGHPRRRFLRAEAEARRARQ